MKTVLLTGFEPFLNHQMNPTQQVASALDGEQLAGFQVKSLVLPVTFREAADTVLKDLSENEPAALIMLGLAAGRTQVTPERVAINVMDGERDNDGVRKEDEPIVASGPDAYFSKLPVRRIVNRMKDHQIPAAISNTAGTYVCNFLMYRVLHALANQGKSIPAGFIHVPYSHEMNLSAQPSLAERDMTQSIRVAIRSLAED
ncbi:pyroglutamyl-peptidase I [Shouchella shacheensis]|uniref:pyroglutamyl-peptidase I n=1 Tax=Shouchella shacheensis TaxID=1649580 RepID=UPI00073FE867|nr:pyroglutamyl-peptidase I [Shouchella shacheensis]